MCGIAGKVSAAEPVERALVERMCSQIVHRGPDSRGVHCEGGVGIGIQRLRVIDLETGDQPIYNEDRTVAVVLNGEIYNYRELRRELESRGHEFATKGDTETIVHLYEERGRDCVRELNGMFAFALWDSRRRRLLLARDRVGKKPLYYSHHGAKGALSFASELAALVEDSDIGRDVNHDAVDCFFAYGYVPAPLTIYRGVRKLPPASTLTFDLARPGSIETDCYWHLDYSKKLAGDERELDEELRRRIGAATRRRLISDVPLGAFLSGGIDSSVVVSEMAAASATPVKTFTIGSEVDAYNELPLAKITAERFGTDHHELIVRPDAIALMPTMVRHYGEPYADTSALPSFYVSEFARRSVTVALNGDGGDENFAGYPRHAANAVTAYIDRAPGPVRRAVAWAGGRLPTGPRTLAARAGQLLSSVDQDALERYRRHVSVFTAPQRERLFAPEFAATIDPSVAAEVIGIPWRQASGRSRLDAMLEVDIATYLPGDLLTKIDIATMTYSLEGRSPLLDPDVMEFAAALPPSQKLNRLRKKWILRRAYRGIVPDRVLDGRKQGFAIPLRDWLRAELRDYTREVLLDPATLARGFFDGDEVARLLAAHDARRDDLSLQIWALLMFEQWYRTFADGGA
jgi:asparagine synthase (glutamine-hydrolysing)